MQILVVEDNDVLREATVAMLQANGMQACGVPCAEDVDDVQLPAPPDIFVLDLNLPDEDGLSLASRLRRAHPRAGIVITSARVQVHERVEGYQAGADVYLSKPVAPVELLAVLNGLSARFTAQPGEAGGLVLEREARLLRGAGQNAHLSQSEVRLLSAFATAREGTLERWQVALQLKPSGAAISADSLQNRISQLRKKLLACGAPGEAIVAIRNAGYRLGAPVTLA